LRQSIWQHGKFRASGLFRFQTSFHSLHLTNRTPRARKLARAAISAETASSRRGFLVRPGLLRFAPRGFLQHPAVAVTFAAPQTRTELDEHFHVLTAETPFANEEYAALAEHAERCGTRGAFAELRREWRGEQPDKPRPQLWINEIGVAGRTGAAAWARACASAARRVGGDRKRRAPFTLQPRPRAH